MVAVCDVDEVHMDEFNKKFDNKLKQYRDYRELLEKEKPEIVTIGTPDHWHVPIAIAALQPAATCIAKSRSRSRSRKASAFATS